MAPVWLPQEGSKLHPGEEKVPLCGSPSAEERKRRVQFYPEMTPEEKVEFIDGEVVMHSPIIKDRFSGIRM